MIPTHRVVQTQRKEGTGRRKYVRGQYNESCDPGLQHHIVHNRYNTLCGGSDSQYPFQYRNYKEDLASKEDIYFTIELGWS